jgi:adenosine deaminase
MQAKGEDVAEWVARGARRAGVEIRYIATFGRDFGVKGNDPTTRAVRGTSVFSGLDLAGNEAVSALPFVPLFRKLKLPATIHAGEAGGPKNVREAIEKFGARRIGHGVRAFTDARLMKMAWEKGVHFELCPTSEIQTGAARSWERHPAWRAFDLPVRFSLNSDDPSLCGIRLSDEFRRARQAGWSEARLRVPLYFAAAAAFLPESGRRKLLRRLLITAPRHTSSTGASPGR